MSKHLDPVRERRGHVGERVRLRSPADWGYPSLVVAASVPAAGVSFTIVLPDAGQTVSVGWLPAMSALAHFGLVGEIVGHDGGAMPGLLPVCDFSDGPSNIWRCCVHPVWLEYLGSGDPLGPECTELTCPVAQLMTRGCTCGRAGRERAAREERDRR